MDSQYGSLKDGIGNKNWIIISTLIGIEGRPLKYQFLLKRYTVPAIALWAKVRQARYKVRGG